MIRLKAESARTKEVYKELSLFTTNKNSNGRMAEFKSCTSYLFLHRTETLPDISTTQVSLVTEHHSEDQSVVVSIATDYWKILPLVNNYFRT